MATVLDELIVKIGLDGSASFNSDVARTKSSLTAVGATARREAGSLEEYLKKTQLETGRRIQQAEEVGRKTAQQFNNVKNNVLGLLGAITGAYGLQQFAKSIIGGDAALGNFAKTLGVSIEQLGTWIEMGKRAGAPAESVKQSFAAINQIQQEIQLYGQSPMTQWFVQMGVALQDSAGKSRPIVDVLKDIGEFTKTHPPEQMRSIFSAIGIPPEMIPLLARGRGELEKLEVALRAQGVATARSAEEDQKFLNQLADLEQIFRDIGRVILGSLMGPMTQALGAVKEWVLANREWIATKFDEGVRAAIPVVKEIAGAIEEVVKFLGGWKVAAEIILGVWVASKVAPLLTFLISLTSMLVGATAATTGLSVAMAKLVVPTWFAAFLRTLPALAALGFIGPAGGEDEEFSKSKNDEYLRNHPGRGGASDERLSIIRDKLAGDQRLGISSAAASGLASNLNAESGIRGINEMNNGPGFGWAQWTNTQGSPRRSSFEAFARGKGLDPSSDEANYEFLVDELRTKYPGVLAQLRRGDISASDAAGVVARGYIVPPADKIPGHVADADRVSKLAPSATTPPTGLRSSGPQLPPRAAVDPGYNLALRAPAAATTNSDYSRTSSVETHVNGPINVQTSATDADGIAKGIGAALQRYAYVPQVNAGLA